MAAVEALERIGCDAAGYRLSGEGVDRLCVVHLWGGWRLLLAFLETEIAVIIDVGEHLAHDPGRDIYQRLYEVRGVRTSIPGGCELRCPAAAPPRAERAHSPW